MKWSKPREGWLKVNINAALFSQAGKYEVGCIVRDHEGGFRGAFHRSCYGIPSVKEAKALGIKEALSWLKAQGLDRFILESDVKVVVESIRSSATPFSFGLVIADCQDLLSSFHEVKLCFVYRTANAVAHLLARSSVNTSGLVDWLDEPSPSIVALLVSDIV